MGTTPGLGKALVDICDNEPLLSTRALLLDTVLDSGVLVRGWYAATIQMAIYRIHMDFTRTRNVYKRFACKWDIFI